jgi:hypothetical protein
MTPRSPASSVGLVGVVLVAAVTAFTRPVAGETGARRASPHHPSITENIECSSCHTQTSW